MNGGTSQALSDPASTFFSVVNHLPHGLAARMMAP
jgi:hypothetical protein